MPTLTIRSVPEHVHRALRLRAAEHGRSVEAEVRALLAAAVAARAEGGVAEERRAFVHDEDLPNAIGLLGQSPPGQSEVDRLVAQRRVEAAYEGEEVTAAEYAHLNERIDAWEIDADWIDRFLAERRGKT